MSKPVCVAYGDGIGPEIMTCVLRILEKAGADISPKVIEVGEKAYKKGEKSGIGDSCWKTIYDCKVFLKAPITTPQGGGYRSLNVTIRKKLGLYANVRPSQAFHPYVATHHPNMDLVVIRENEEGLYTGIEYQLSQNVVECLKILSRPACRKISQFAFDYATAQNRKKVTCFTKDNIMKKTDGLFRKMFEEVGAYYPDIEKEHWIVDIGAAKLAHTPENFDVLVLPNLYGDILSDVTAQISGSVGMAGAANVGDEYAMFEAIHGSAPRRAGQNMANPSGLLQGTLLMLDHIGLSNIGQKIRNAWLKTLEDGLHTYDIYKEDISKKKMGTKEFSQAIMDRLGEEPSKLKQALPPVSSQKSTVSIPPQKKQKKELVGVDVYIEHNQGDIKEVVNAVKNSGSGLELKSIYSRGICIWPDQASHVVLSELLCLRFMQSGSHLTGTQVVELLSKLQKQGITACKTQNLYLYDGEKGFSL